ncbi:MAG TPA: tetratricopeptide repeat protein, partial [Burkholderiaceae bacterium]
MKPRLLICAAALWSAAAFALPSLQDVESAVKAGNYAQADTMMQEVVAAKPQSAKAHYVYAEILAHEARFTDAAAQARQARALDPKIGFTDPAKFRSFQQELDREQGVGAPAAAPRSVPQARYDAPAYRQSPGLP